MTTEERTPLAWPAGFPRTKEPQESKFGNHTTTEAFREIQRQLSLMGRVQSVTFTYNAAMLGQPKDKGVAVYFTLATKWNSEKKDHDTVRFVIPCDRWNKQQDNLWAVAKHVEALRGQQRWGCGTLERDFAGYRALPEQTSGKGWWEILELRQDATVEQIETAYRKLAKVRHPDAGGTNEAFIELGKAFSEGVNAARAQGISK